jgi:hypothetical protein
MEDALAALDAVGVGASVVEGACRPDPTLPFALRVCMCVYFALFTPRPVSISSSQAATAGPPMPVELSLRSLAVAVAACPSFDKGLHAATAAHPACAEGDL